MDDGFLCIVSANGVRFKLLIDEEINPKQAGAYGDWSNDDGTAIQAAFAASQALSIAWTNTGSGENPTSASKHPVKLTKGIYSSSVPLTDTTPYNFCTYSGTMQLLQIRRYEQLITRSSLVMTGQWRA